jgi:hypothetical protein
MKAVLLAETATVDCNGNTTNQQQQAMEGNSMVVESCTWINMTAGLCKAEIAQPQDPKTVFKT